MFNTEMWTPLGYRECPLIRGFPGRNCSDYANALSTLNFRVYVCCNCVHMQSDKVLIDNRCICTAPIIILVLM